MALITLILLAITLFLLTIAALLAGAVGIAYALRWVWPAIDPGSATIVGLLALLFTIQIAWRFINQVSREETETGNDEDEDEGAEDVDEEEARRIRRVMWRVQPDTEAYIPKRRRRKRRG